MTQEMNIQTAFQDVMAASGDIPPKQKRVLAASLELFAAHGFANTTTKEIAARADVAEGTVYRRYKTKNELLAAVLAPFTTEVLPRLVEEFAAKVIRQEYMTRHDLITAVVTDRLQFLQDNGQVMRVLATEIMVRADLREQFLKRAVPLVQRNLYPLLERLKADGELVDWPNDRIAQFMIGTMVSQFVRSNLAAEPVTTAGPLMIDFLEKGLAPK
ncbi:TetR/AcrR family transcriptional regulator [Levilactobacillus yiduensis]|uniref:TetR/AcrR family transcriptional regulator n=1 Tax=Levilactobacillus yiduensis TaxID=2953880 RepID=UPI000EF2AC04|nr:TetR/AcrR family transcriptional regulator [Levilactobacillus yiduensis]AYM04015.1 TetR/AcrR family transcriptional regulator [Levilactobacillus brevis]